ncbi:MAG: hypothetical protein R3F07_19500 [Opitutaceae bacterium]
MSFDPSYSSPADAPTHVWQGICRLLRFLPSLSLDAPLVCLGWLLLFARIGGVHLSPGGPVVLFLSVWLAYAADRWFDTWRIRSPAFATDRHAFSVRHRRAIAAIWIAVLSLAMTLAFATLDRDHLLRGFVLLGGVLTYFAAVHLGPPRLRRSIPKEPVTALVLVSGIRVFLPHGSPPFPLLIGIGLLFLGNCLLIAAWEAHSDRHHRFASMAVNVPFSLPATRSLLWALLAMALLSPVFLEHPSTLIGLPIGLSAALLLVLDRTSARVPPAILRSLADISLMTPWLLWLGLGLTALF